METTQLVYDHVFKMGQAPYKLIGYWEMPSASLAEVNPTAYNNAMAGAPKGCRGSCSHCGTGIIHHFIIQDAKGEKFAVGSSCVSKTHDAKLITAVEKHQKEAARIKRLAVKEAKRVAAVAKQNAILEQQRLVNGGKTDAELKEIARLTQAEIDVAFNYSLAKDLVDVLKVSGGFGKEVSLNLLKGQVPFGRGVAISASIYAKSFGRSNSAVYASQYDYATNLISDISTKLKKI